MGNKSQAISRLNNQKDLLDHLCVNMRPSELKKCEHLDELILQFVSELNLKPIIKLAGEEPNSLFEEFKS